MSPKTTDQKPPTLPPEKAIKVLTQQHEELKKFIGQNHAEAKSAKDKWEQFMQSIIEAAYGNPSSELSRFCGAKNIGEFNLMGNSPQVQQSNFDRQIDGLGALLNAMISTLRLQLPEEEIKGAYDAGDEYSFYRDLSVLIAAATKSIHFVDAYLDEQLFNLYVSKISNNVPVHILSNKISNNVETVGKMYAKNRHLEMRSSPDVHDRVIFIDQRGWVVGQSIKDAAKKKPTYLIELNEPMLTATRDAHLRIWTAATVIIGVN